MTTAPTKPATSKLAQVATGTVAKPERVVPGKTYRCSGDCGKIKPIADFAKNNRSAIGHLTLCKKCMGLNIAKGHAKSRMVAEEAAKAAEIRDAEDRQIALDLEAAFMLRDPEGAPVATDLAISADIKNEIIRLAVQARGMAMMDDRINDHATELEVLVRTMEAS